MLLMAHLGPDTITEIQLEEEEEEPELGQKEEEDLQGANQECLLTKCQTTITGTCSAPPLRPQCSQIKLFSMARRVKRGRTAFREIRKDLGHSILVRHQVLVLMHYLVRTFCLCVKVVIGGAMDVVFVSELREKLSQAVQEKTQAVVDVEALRDHLRDTREEVSRSGACHPHRLIPW